MLNLIAVFLVCSGIGIAVHIAIDLTHRPQSMKIMNALYGRIISSGGAVR